MFDIPHQVSYVTSRLKEHGYEAWLVGGCVRDLFMGNKPKDWDVTTNARPDQIMAVFPHTFYENDYGTVGVVGEDVTDETLKIIEVTPYRKEGTYSDARRPDSVSFSATLEEDLARRDFTMNAVAYDIENNVVVDLFSGRKDMQDGMIRAVGDAPKRFSEDALRMMRAARLASELGFDISRETLDGMFENAPEIKRISQERVRDELIRLVMSDNPERGMQVLLKTKIMSFIIPELDACFGVEQGGVHAYDVGTHLMKSLGHASAKKFDLTIRLAALFHDIGKPPTRRGGGAHKEWTFYGHEVAGAKIARRILEGLRFPKETVASVTSLVRWHMFFSDTEQITPSAVRRLIANVGQDLIWDLIKVRQCDRIGTGRPQENPYRLRKYQAMIESVMRDPVSVKMLAIKGDFLMKALDIHPGPVVGHVLAILLDAVLDTPEKNTEEALLAMARELIQIPENELAERARESRAKIDGVEQEERGKLARKHAIDAI
jgi:poly(A) polymerase/tRNA nucleotidyltransferase (CCA-adding enzyme)